MELVTEPDTYVPSLDDMGNYVDKIPSFATVKNGIRCPCGSRKDHVYESYSVFSQHTKSKAHQKWIQGLNLNKANFYVENQELKSTIQQQRIIIAKLEKDIQNKSMTIDFLTQQLTTKNVKDVKVVNNLLDFD